MSNVSWPVSFPFVITFKNTIKYNRLTAKVIKLSKESKKNEWINTCESLILDREGHKALKLLNKLHGKKTKRIHVIDA